MPRGRPYLTLAEPAARGRNGWVERLIDLLRGVLR
jgi:hypothetical protein